MHRLHSVSSRLASIVLIGVAVVGLLAAVLNPGIRATEVDLHDGGVWVTNAQKKLVAHLNYAAQDFDSALRMTTSSLDVFQDGNDVFVTDGEAHTISPVDVARTALGTGIDTTDLHVTVRGTRAAFASEKDGHVWAQSTHAMHTVTSDTDEPTIADMPHAKVAIGADGTVFAVSAQAQRVASASADTPPGAAAVTDLPHTSANDDVDITVVGNEPVVLNRTTNTLHFSEQRMVKIPDASEVVLQQPSAAFDDVLLATPDGLMFVPFDSGEPRIIDAPVPGGRPVAPVRMPTCAYGAWMGTGAFLKDCDTDSLDQQLTVDSLAKARNSVFRVNRNLVVLNDLDTGNLWLPDKNMLLIEDWDQVESTLTSDEQDEDDESASQNNDVAQAEQREENTPPIAVDDTFGVRAGRANVLPVLNNDSDPDGDYIVVTHVDPTPLGEVSISRDGGALSIRVPQGATGSAALTYEIDDGRGGTARATVTISVHGADVNSPPVQTTKASVSMSVGRTATINTLTYWYDPDGDPFYLADAIVPEGLTARFRETGTVDVAEAGHGPGDTAITLRVSDGRDTGEGELSVLIRDDANLPPIANPDHVVLLVGQTASVSPLDNDVDPNGDLLRIVQVDTGNVSVSAQLDGALGTVTLTGNAVGTQYLGYVITDGPSSVKGFIRADVIEVPDNPTPTAEDDLGVLPDVGQVLIDLLANDYDPAGGVLTVAAIHVPSNSPLQVSLIDRHIVRVTAPQRLGSVAHFTYTVTNGQAQADAHVTIIPGGAADVTAAPLLTDDTLVVRVGDVGSVRVLDNDRSPVGLSMTVNNTLQTVLEPAVGTAFISDNVVRFRGGTTPGTGTVTYTVTDSAGNISSATVHVTVVDVDEENNTAPMPRVLTSRTTAGQSVRIPVPLDGIDREGDSVTLVGMGSSPKLGTADQHGDSFVYTAGETAVGTDTFSYIVEDRLGKQSTGTIRIGISPASSTNQPPVAIPDEVNVRPGKKVSIPVVQNDLDPDDDPLTLIPDGVRSRDKGLVFAVRGNAVVVDSPTTEGTYLLTYRITDRYGATAEGLVTVLVNSQAPLRAPIARDDVLTDQQILDAKRTGKITVDVRQNDSDPDGDIGATTVTTADASAAVTDAGELTITLADKPQIIIYTVTDTDNQAASAFVRVPGKDTTRPTLDLSASLIRVKAGERIDIPLNDYITSRDGRSVQLLSTTSVSAGIGADGSSLVKDRTTLTFRSTPEFSGRTSITAEVTDATDPSDQNSQTATVTLPIEVEAAGNRKPTLRLTPVVLQRGGEPITVNLAVGASDPDPADAGKLTFELASEPPAGISATLSGATLTLSASDEATIGTSGSLLVRVKDPQDASADASIALSVQGADPVYPPIQTTEARITLRGADTVPVDVTSYATQPHPDRPVRLIGEPQVSAGGRVSVSGNTITVGAEDGYNGTITVTYTVTDSESASPGRQATGRIIANVLSRPNAPRSVQAVAASPTAVRVSWVGGANGGSPISGFTVTDHTQGDSIDCGVVTQCVMRNRTTGTLHVFSVVASNEVGQSDESERAEVMLDVAPDTPGAPQVDVGDGQVTVSWQPPTNAGTPISEYEVDLSPGVTRTVRPRGSGTQTLVIDGLTNGIQYVARVRATNAVGASQWSAPSISAVPYGAPEAVNSLTIYPLADYETEQGTTAVVVQWIPAANNGRSVEYYTVSGAGITQSVPAGTGTSVLLTNIPLSNEQLTFTVTATNDSRRPHLFTSAPASVTQWVVGTPPTPTIVSATPTGQNTQVRLDWRRAEDGRGWRSSELAYEWSTDGSTWQPLSDSTISGGGLVNGQSSVIKIRSVGYKTGSPLYSREVASPSVTPYGPPIAALITCSPRQLGVECEWSGGSGNGRPAIYRLNYPTATVVPARGSQLFPAAAGETLAVCIDVIQSESGNSIQSCHSAVADDVPKPQQTPPLVMRHDNLKVFLTLRGFQEAWTEIHCWNAATPGDRRPPNLITGDPGNYLGEAVGSILLPENGEIGFHCSGNPIDNSLQADANFRIMLTATNEWIGPTP